MLSGTREKDTRKERSSSPREARNAPDRASARSGRDATVLTGSDVAPASIGKEHSAGRSAALLLLVRRSSRDVPPSAYCFHACKRERCAEAGALHALLLLRKARLEPAVALGNARLARLRAVCSRGARFSAEIPAVCGLFEGPGLRERAGGVACGCSGSPGVLFAPSALGRRSRGARES
jgi:hypothetical protein